MKTGVIIQARMASTRFPGKVLAELNGAPVIERVVSRCRNSDAGKVVVATSTNPLDDAIAEWCDNRGVDFSRGPEDDVLTRVLQAAYTHSIDLVVRVCCDSPSIDPARIDQLLDEWDYHHQYVAYTVNNKPAVLGHYGLPELITRAALGQLHNHALRMQEHVTWGAYTRLPVSCKWLPVIAEDDRTIDTPEDLERLWAPT